MRVATGGDAKVVEKCLILFHVVPRHRAVSTFTAELIPITSGVNGQCEFHSSKKFADGFHRDLRSFEIRFEFESAVPIRFGSTLMGRFENFRIGRVCPLLVVVRRLKPLTALSGTVYRLASSMGDHTPVLFNVFEPLRIGKRNL